MKLMVLMVLKMMTMVIVMGKTVIVLRDVGVSENRGPK